jgi:hypothetical protein
MTSFVPCMSEKPIIRRMGVTLATPAVEATAAAVSGDRNWADPATVLLAPGGSTSTEPGALSR